MSFIDNHERTLKEIASNPKTRSKLTGSTDVSGDQQQGSISTDGPNLRGRSLEYRMYRNKSLLDEIIEQLLRGDTFVLQMLSNEIRNSSFSGLQNIITALAQAAANGKGTAITALTQLTQVADRSHSLNASIIRGAIEKVSDRAQNPSALSEILHGKQTAPQPRS